MPLDKKVTFQTRLQRQNRIQVPAHLRWQYKLEPTEVLKVTVNFIGMWDTTRSFYATIQKNDRIAIPKLTMALMKRAKPILEGYAMEVTIQPP
jgi:hypothetical protein